MVPHCPSIIKVSNTIVSFIMCLWTMWHLAMCRLANCLLEKCHRATSSAAEFLHPPLWDEKNAFCPKWQHGKYKTAEKYRIMKSFPGARCCNKTWFLGRCENFPHTFILNNQKGPNNNPRAIPLLSCWLHPEFLRWLLSQCHVCLIGALKGPGVFSIAW